MGSFDLYSICHPLYDIQAEVGDDLLQTLGFTKGGAHMVDHEVQRTLVPRIYEHIVNAESGGSGANTAIGIVQLGGKAAFAGRVGEDEHGRLYAEGLRTRRVVANLPASPTDTGICIVLVTPDAQRTMVTYLGASTHLTERDLDLDHLCSSRFLYLTSYLFDESGPSAAARAAVRHAEAHGVRIALALCDAGVVERLREPLAEFCAQRAHVVIANEQESCLLTECGTADEAVALMSEGGRIAAVTLGSQGALVGAAGSVAAIPATAAKAVDRTGAGDMFSAGLLYGLARGWHPDQAARLAVASAAQVVEHLGARLPVCADLSGLAAKHAPRVQERVH